ncbi:MAG: septal ring lytic transglycosylase RlpA family lipoprotein, partial [Gammaproteobacteria bacterium]
MKTSTPGGYYGGDRPPTKIDKDLASIPDAVPVKLPLSKTGNNPYTALGKTYRPMRKANGYKARGTASWYGKKFHGRRTSSGETYDMFA